MASTPDPITTGDLVLDPAIRNWVLFPIVVVMFLVTVLRHHINILITSPKKGKLVDTANAALLKRGEAFRRHGHFLPRGSFEARKSYYAAENTGVFAVEKPDPNAAPPNPMAGAGPMGDPSNMTEMMKKNMTMLIPQMLLMAWVNHFFSGFVIIKLPFSLTAQFKTMLQRGVEMSSLDPAYVSALSWYFLNVFGLRGLTSVVLGGANIVDDTQLMAGGMMGGMGGSPGAAPAPGMAGQPDDYKKKFNTQRDQIATVVHMNAIDSAEQRLLVLKGY